MMRESVAVFYVNAKDYGTACNYGSTEILVQYMENYSTDMEKMDFIIICNNDKFILKNFIAAIFSPFCRLRRFAAANVQPAAVDWPRPGVFLPAAPGLPTAQIWAKPTFGQSAKAP